MKAARELLLGLNRNALSAPRLLMVVTNGTVSGGLCNVKILSEASCTNPNFIFTGKKKNKPMSTNEILSFNFSRQKRCSLTVSRLCDHTHTYVYVVVCTKVKAGLQHAKESYKWTI